MIGSPSYDGKLDVWYVNSLIQTVSLADRYNIEIIPIWVSFDALIQRCRNDTLALALLQDCDDLIWIDTDIEWEPEWVYKLLDYPVDVVGGTYPKKGDTVEEYVLNLGNNTGEINALGLMEVCGLGTGFLRFSRAACQWLWDNSPVYVEKEKGNIKDQEYQLRTRELEKQIEDQKKLVDEMKRKAEQGSMQLQGEVQELILEELLRSTFPFDKVEEVGKGVRGADCIQTVRNQFGIETGKIIYESKRTKDFSNEWIEKLKADMRTLGADVAIIVTQTLPKDMQQFGEKEGVYICTYMEVRSVALLLRNTILKLFDAKKSQENKGDKMVMLYDYLTNNEFNEQWKAIREGFMSMKLSIQKERDAMEKLWKSREKQLEKVLLNAAHIRGSIEGIAGSDAVNMNLLEDDNNSLLED